MADNLDFEAWRCCHENAGENLFCPPEGCPKSFCARDNAWLPGMDSPAECVGYQVLKNSPDSPGANGAPEATRGADEFADHQYFEADFTSYRQSEDLEECVAVFVGEKPYRNEDGNKVMSVRFPAIIVSEWTSNPMEFAKTVAEVLQENAHRFFSTAIKPEDANG